MTVTNKRHVELNEIQQQIYLLQNWSLTNYQEEKQNIAYGACTFMLNKMSIRFRAAKLTPKKIGHFVTFWHRNQLGESQPYSLTNATDLLVISTKKEQQFGHFVFPKSLLIEKGILTTSQQQGKRGIRVYPIWEEPTSKQALKTKAWQIPYFIDLSAPITDIQQKALALYVSN